jgi:Na+-translocating ferredoxin:NAD+ oxidoreductase RnfD subunit
VAAAAAARNKRRGMLGLRSIKTQLILFLLSFAIFLLARERDFNFVVTLLVAVASAVLVDSLILYLKTKSLQITESSIITGMIIGYVLSADEAWWKFVFAVAIAILAKHVIRFQKKHIFNPAAFGVLLTLVFFGAQTQWKGTYLWYILLPFGLYFARKVRKLEIILGYAVVSLLLFGIQAALRHFPFWGVFGYFSYLYIFVMVIEPKTTPITSAAKYIFGAGTAALIFILTEAGVRFDAELFSLLVMNATVPLLNKIHLKSTRP